MRLPRDSATLVTSAVSSSPPSATSYKLVGNKENVQPDGVGGGSGSGSSNGGSSGGESTAAANLLWLLDFRLDNLLPNDGNNADKMTNAHQGKSLVLRPALSGVVTKVKFLFELGYLVPLT